MDIRALVDKDNMDIRALVDKDNMDIRALVDKDNMDIRAPRIRINRPQHNMMKLRII
jgi:hypothetical protein